MPALVQGTTSLTLSSNACATPTRSGISFPESIYFVASVRLFLPLFGQEQSTLESLSASSVSNLKLPYDKSKELTKDEDWPGKTVLRGMTRHSPDNLRLPKPKSQACFSGRDQARSVVVREETQPYRYLSDLAATGHVPDISDAASLRGLCNLVAGVVEIMQGMPSRGEPCPELCEGMGVASSVKTARTSVQRP